MNKPERQKQNILYLVTCAARSAEPMNIEDFIELAQAALWDVYVIATPQATKFINISVLENFTGHPVRSEYRHPEKTNSLPVADAIIVAPTTFNTINKWVSGITDTLALGVLCEYMGLGTPIVTIPCVPQESLARHPAFKKNLALLKEYGVIVLYEPEKYPPMNNVPWEVALHTLNSTIKNNSLIEQAEEVY